MFINEKREIIVFSRNKKWYEKKGYKINKAYEKITINTIDISPYSKEKIKFECEYCHEIKEEEAFKYFKHKGKDCCGKCSYLKTAEILKEKNRKDWFFQTDEFKEKSKQTSMKKYNTTKYSKTKEAKERNKKYFLKKYGYESPIQVPEIKEKMQKTVLEKYGEKNVFQSNIIKEKIKETDLIKYGFTHHMKNKEVKEKFFNALYNNKKYVNKIPCSKNQKHICALFNGELNKMFSPYCVDMFFEKENIYLEYDGTGHDMSVKKKNGITKEEFKRREIIRYKFLKNKGLKEIRIVSLTNNNLPDDEFLLRIKEYGFSFFREQKNENWIVFDFDKNEVRTKEKILPLNIINN